MKDYLSSTQSLRNRLKRFLCWLGVNNRYQSVFCDPKLSDRYVTPPQAK